VRWAAAALLLAVLLAGPAGRPARAQEPRGTIEEHLALDTDDVRVALLTFPPGAASGQHVSLDPELGIVLEGELVLVTPAGREVLPAGAVRWLPGLTPHDTRNETDRPARLWVILFKR
jgi:quercetin dioxygenase-like cupin family protein